MTDASASLYYWLDLSHIFTTWTHDKDKPNRLSFYSRCELIISLTSDNNDVAVGLALVCQ